MLYNLCQVFCWWLLIMTTISLARILPATSLGRIPIFPPISGCGFLFPHSVYHRRNILRRGLLTTALRSSRLIHEQDTRSQADDVRQNKLPTGGAAPATPLVAHKPRRDFNYKLWNPLLARSRSLRALSAHLVDRDRPRQARPIPCRLGLSHAAIGVWISAYGCVSAVSPSLRSSRASLHISAPGALFSPAQPLSA